jgi:hypothetical protein
MDSAQDSARRRRPFHRARGIEWPSRQVNLHSARATNQADAQLSVETTLLSGVMRFQVVSTMITVIASLLTTK